MQGNPIVETLGFAVEVSQWLKEGPNSYQSAFSPEDLPSNSAGDDFGGFANDFLKANPGADLSDEFGEWATAAGADDGQDYTSAFNALPSTDPSLPNNPQRRGSSNASSTPPQDSSTSYTIDTPCDGWSGSSNASGYGRAAGNNLQCF